MTKRFAGFAALVLVAGCGGGQPVAETNVTASTETNILPPEANIAEMNFALANSAEAANWLQLAEDGLWLALPNGRSQRSGFGASREIAVPMISTALGAPTDQGTNPECGAGPLDNVDFKGGLTLFFQDGRFVGWSVDGREQGGYKTTSGIGIGSTLQHLRDSGDVMVQSTSLGHEFTAGDLGGLLTSNTPDGTITNLWAGTTCAFR